MRLELDVGNTRTKWRLWDGSVVFRCGLDLSSELALKPAWLAAVGRVWVSSVHRERDAQILSLFPQAQFASSQVSHKGLSNSYQDAHKMGVDRWLAMLAAWHDEPTRAHIVIDAGTAITLDVIDEFGRHVGGYICPGFTMMKSSLLGGTKRVQAADDWQLGRALGSNTQSCVDHGIQDMVACWLERHRAAQPHAKIWVSGGDGERLVSLLSSPVVFEADLVLDGLKIYFS
ncbi:MAG: type III pantothenate kinase [Bermanella sp.]